MERNVKISNVLEEMDLVLLQEQGSGDRVDWRIAPSFVEEAAILVQGIEVRGVGFRSPQLQAGDFKVGPEVAPVVRLSVVKGNPFHHVVLGDVLRVFSDEFLGDVP